MGPDATIFKSYFPKGSWVSLTDYSSIVNSQGEWVELSANQSKVHSHLKPGSIIGIQENEVEEGRFVNTTADLLTRHISILVNRNENG